MSWADLLRCFGRKDFKSLIYKGSVANLEILWITLLISTVEWLPRRMAQGLEQTASKKCKPRILYESMTYEGLKFLEMLQKKKPTWCTGPTFLCISVNLK